MARSHPTSPERWRWAVRGSVCWSTRTRVRCSMWVAAATGHRPNSLRSCGSVTAPAYAPAAPPRPRAASWTTRCRGTKAGPPRPPTSRLYAPPITRSRRSAPSSYATATTPAMNGSLPPATATYATPRASSNDSPHSASKPAKATGPTRSPTNRPSRGPPFGRGRRRHQAAAGDSGSRQPSTAHAAEHRPRRPIRLETGAIDAELGLLACEAFEHELVDEPGPGERRESKVGLRGLRCLLIPVHADGVNCLGCLLR